MKKISNFLLLFLVLGFILFLSYTYKDAISPRLMSIWAKIESQFFAKVPCAKPIPYKLGTFDTQFNISKSYFLSAISDAETIWEKPSGKNLFIYAPTDFSEGVLKINLIYDYRQQATSKLASLGITVKDDRASYDMLKTKFTALKTEYVTENNAFNLRLEAFNKPI